VASAVEQHQTLRRCVPCAAYGRGRTTSMTAMQLVSGLHHLVLEYFFEVPGDTSNPMLVSHRPALGRSTRSRPKQSVQPGVAPSDAGTVIRAAGCCAPSRWPLTCTTHSRWACI